MWRCEACTFSFEFDPSLEMRKKHAEICRGYPPDREMGAFKTFFKAFTDELTGKSDYGWPDSDYEDSVPDKSQQPGVSDEDKRAIERARRVLEDDS